VSLLELGKSIHLGDIKAPPGVEILGDKHLSVISVAIPRTEEEEVAVTAEGETAAGDVEMIKEKKEDGEEGVAPAKGEKGAAGKPGEKGAATKPGEKASAKGAEKGAAAAPEKGATKHGEKAPAEKKK